MQKLAFGEGLMALRAGRGMTRQALSEVSGIPLRSLVAYETEGVQPPIDRAKRIADALGVTVNDLIPATVPAAA